MKNMTIRPLRLYLLVITLHLTLPGYASATEQPGPNVVLVVVNALRADHLQCYGYGRTTTPTLDRLADSSLLFTRAFSQSGYTMPSMMTLFTSLYPDSHMVYDAFKDRLDDGEIRTMAELLAQNNYRTGWFAMLGLGHLAPEAGFTRGFADQVHLGDQLEGRHKLFEWIKSRDGRPFFAAVHVRHTHRPYITWPRYRQSFLPRGEEPLFVDPDDFKGAVYRAIISGLEAKGGGLEGLVADADRKREVELFNGQYRPGKLERLVEMVESGRRYLIGHLQTEEFYRRARNLGDRGREKMVAMYDATILATDQELLKPLLALLREEGVYENTLLIVTSDHGDSFGEHGLFGPSPKLYENLVHVPLLIKLPGVEHGGQRIPVPVGGVDILPTVLDVAGIRAPRYLQGQSLVALLKRGGKSQQREVFGASRDYAYMRAADWKLLAKRENGAWSEGEANLYDLASDPGESRDLKKENRKRFESMSAALRAHLQALPHYGVPNGRFYPNIGAETRRRIRETGYW